MRPKGHDSRGGAERGTKPLGMELEKPSLPTKLRLKEVDQTGMSLTERQE